MQGRLTKRTVDALLPAADGREVVLWDSELAGFGVRVQRGNFKAYILKYRAGRGRSAPLRKVTIGKHGSPWTPDEARAEAKRLLGLVAHGKDPAIARSAAKAAPTVADLAKRFLAEHVEAKRKASTAKEYRRLLDHVVLPALGKKRVAVDHTAGRGTAAPRAAGDSNRGEQSARRHLQDVQHGRALVRAAGRLQSVPARRKISPAAAGAHALRGGVGAIGRRARWL